MGATAPSQNRANKQHLGTHPQKYLKYNYDQFQKANVVDMKNKMTGSGSGSGSEERDKEKEAKAAQMRIQWELMLKQRTNPSIPGPHDKNRLVDSDDEQPNTHQKSSSVNVCFFSFFLRGFSFYFFLGWAWYVFSER
jgi:hypothetical protein